MSLKTSTCVLLKPDKTFHSFGYDAEQQYAYVASSDTGEHKEWYYFRHFKMQLFDKKVEVKQTYPYFISFNSRPNSECAIALTSVSSP